jgi:hypothetical protein
VTLLVRDEGPPRNVAGIVVVVQLAQDGVKVGALHPAHVVVEEDHAAPSDEAGQREPDRAFQSGVGRAGELPPPGGVRPQAR